MARALRWGLLSALVALAWPAAAVSAVSSWGGGGVGPGQFTLPGGIAVDSVGNVYVSDRLVARIQKFTNTGTFITEWGSPGSAEGQFMRPHGVAVDASDRIYVVDRGNNRVQRFDSSGAFQTAWDVGDGVTGVAVSNAGDVYVSGGSRFIVQKFDADGNPLTSWGSGGTSDGEFQAQLNSPAVDASGNVYVTDGVNNHRIQKFDANGAFILKWDTGPGQFPQNPEPHSVAVGPDGSVLVPKSDGVVQKFDGNGVLLGTAQYPVLGTEPRIAVDAQGNIFVRSGTMVVRIDPTTPVADLDGSPTLALTGEAVTLDASDSEAPFATMSKFEWDLDGDGVFELDSGTDPVLVQRFSRIGTVTPVVRVTAPSGKTATASGAAIEIRAAPPEGEPGVSINNGAVFTNDPDVTLRVVWPPFTIDARVSNDGGFVPTTVFPVSQSIPWTLQESGPERLPKTVYLRFDLTGSQTFADDIILDQTPPTVNSVKASVRRSLAVASASRVSYTLKIKASDNVSGVERMQVTSNRRKPGDLKPFASTARLTTKATRAFVRVQDAAGNLSKWKSVALASAVTITKIRFDSPGRDSRSNRSLNGEWVRVTNTSNKRVALTGWKLRDAANHVYRFGKFTLGRRASVKIHTGTGNNTKRHRYWGQDNHIWNNTGDTATLKNKTGKRVARCTYKGSSKSPTAC